MFFANQLLIVKSFTFSAVTTVVAKKTNACYVEGNIQAGSPDDADKNGRSRILADKENDSTSELFI